MYQDITTIYGAGAIDGVMGEMFFGGLPYFRYWKNNKHGLLRASYLMPLIQCYALLDTSSGRFPWSLLPVVFDML